MLAGRCGAIMKQWLVMGQMLETVPLLCDWDVLVGQWIRMLGKPLPTIFSWKRSFVDPGLHGIIEWLRLEGTLKTLSSSNPSAVGWVPPTSSGCPGLHPWPWTPPGMETLHELSYFMDKYSFWYPAQKGCPSLLLLFYQSTREECTNVFL